MISLINRNVLLRPYHGKWMQEGYEAGLVSVIIPTYNRRNMLIEAMGSVFSQTYRPIEIIVVDDGSTDGSDQAVEKWKQKYSQEPNFRIVYYYQKISGAPVARNKGLLASKGEFIQFLDSDDLLHPSKLQFHVNVLIDNPNCQYFWSDWRSFQTKEYNQLLKIHDPLKEHIEMIKVKGKKLDHVPPQMWAGLFRRQICGLIGPWNEKLSRLQDWEYTTRLLSYTKNAIYISKTLYFVRVHEQGRIGDAEKNVFLILSSISSAIQAVEDAFNLDNGDLPWIVRLRAASIYYGGMYTAIRANKMYNRGIDLAPLDSFLSIKLFLLNILFKLTDSSVVEYLHNRAHGLRQLLIVWLNYPKKTGFHSRRWR